LDYAEEKLAAFLQILLWKRYNYSGLEGEGQKVPGLVVSSRKHHTGLIEVWGTIKNSVPDQYF
jgi:hypothetical protein